jgi:PGF-pre-PGF domain-containing protein
MRHVWAYISIAIVIVVGLVSFSYAQFQDDGSVSQTPGVCGYLNTDNAIYTVANSSIYVNGTCFYINATNVTINLNSSIIYGNGTGYGINISNFTQATIYNGTISNFSRGIYGIYANDTNITNMTQQSNIYGVYFELGQDSTVRSTNFFYNTYGSQFVSSKNITIIDNEFQMNSIGMNIIMLTNSSMIRNLHYNCTFSCLNINNSDYIRVENSTYNLSGILHVNISNTNGLNLTRLVHYYANTSSVYIAYSPKARIKDITSSLATYDFLVAGSESVNFTNNTGLSNYSSWFVSTNHSIIKYNRFRSSLVVGSENLTLSNNSFINTRLYGLWTLSLSNSTIEKTRFQNVSNPLFLTTTLDNTFDQLHITGSNTTSIALFGSNNNNFTDINITNTNRTGVLVKDDLLYGTSINNLFKDNIINTTGYGINVSGADNIFINNSVDRAITDYLIYENIKQYSFENNSLAFTASNTWLQYHNRTIRDIGYNLSEKVSVTSNNIFVNSTLDPTFNQSANITSQYLSYPIPKSLIDYNTNGTWVNCPDTYCQNVSWDGENFTFNVTRFSSYKTASIADLYHCDNITVKNISYNIVNSIYSSGLCFNISAENITLNLGGNTLSGSNNPGIFARSRNVTILNGTLKAFSIPIEIAGTQTVNLDTLTFWNSTYGAYLADVSDVTAINITTYNTTYGIYLNNSATSTISDSDFYDNSYALYFKNASSTTVSYSNIYNNTIYMYINDSGTIDAEYNYWQNMTSLSIGNGINGTADYDPWLTTLHPDLTAPDITITATSPFTTSRKVNFSIVSDDRINIKYRFNTSSGWSSWSDNCYTIVNDQDGDGICDSETVPSNGKYIFNFLATNIYGNFTYKNKTIIVNQNTSSGGTIITGGGSGGGGGGGGTSQIVSKAWTSLEGDASYTINKEDFGLSQITFSVIGKLLSSKLTVKKMGLKPNLAQNLSGTIYRYYEITRDNLPHNNITDIKLYFKIDKSWMGSKNINDIKMNRYNNGWQELDTRFIESDNSYYYYYAITPGFSYFGISYVSTTPITTTTLGLLTTSTLTLTTTTLSENQDQEIMAFKSDIVQDPVNDTKDEGQKKRNYIPFIIISSIVAIMVVLGVVFRDQLRYNVYPKIEPVFGMIYINFLDLISRFKKQDQKDKKYSIDDEEYSVADLEEYIKESLKKGFTEIEIKDQLVKEGVSRNLLDKSFDEVGHSVITPSEKRPVKKEDK